MPSAPEIYGKPWSDGEYLIVLDGYLRSKGRPRHGESAEVIEIARVLGRTPASVNMRMDNYASIDPEVAVRRRGLDNAGRNCAMHWEKWSRRPSELAEVVEILRNEKTGEGRSVQAKLFQSSAVQIPKAFGRYELLDHLGRGTFGTVYSCIDDKGMTRALKIITAEGLGDAEMLQRFIREIRVLRTVENPHVIRMHEDNLETERDFPAYVMDLADTTLFRYLAERGDDESVELRLSHGEAADIVRQICSGVRALHEHPSQVIHRDINPNNILRKPSGEWVLADFGLAKFLNKAPVSTAFASATRRGGWGTAYYGAPEQFQNLKLTDVRTDVYALAVLVWELFTNAFPPPDRDDLGLPSPLSDVFVKATARAMDRRYRSVKEFEDAFEEAYRLSGF